MKSSLCSETASASAAFFDDLVVLVLRDKLDQAVKPGLHGDLEQASVFGGDVPVASRLLSISRSRTAVRCGTN